MWPGALIVFLVWVSYGLVQWRRSAQLLETVRAIPERKRRALATLIIFVSAALLLGGLYGIALIAPNQQSLNVLQWICVAVLGLLFVHAQTMAAAMILSQAHFVVTKTSPPPSTSQDSEG